MGPISVKLGPYEKWKEGTGEDIWDRNPGERLCEDRGRDWE